MNSNKFSDRRARLLVGIVLLWGSMAGNSAADTNFAESKNFVTPKLGTYTLANRHQDMKIVGEKGCFLFCLLEGYPLLPLANEFDTASRAVVGLAYERRTDRGFSYGADLLHVRNSFETPTLGPSSGEMRTIFLFATMQKYFGDPDGVRPYMSVGIGPVDAKLSGSVSRSASGYAAQALAGVRYHSARIYAVAEFRYVYAPSLDIEHEVRTGEIAGSLNLSGQGYFVGLGLRF